MQAELLLIENFGRAEVVLKLFAIEASEIATPGLLRIEGNTLAEMRVSHSHNIVASVEERLLNILARTLESHTPSLCRERRRPRGDGQHWQRVVK